VRAAEAAYRSLRDADALDDIRACAALLRARGVQKVGITGFCMGGRLTYLSAVSGVDVQAAVPFYGAGIDAVRKHHPREVIAYPDTGHGFMRDGSDSFHEPSATEAWKRLLDFSAANLAGGPPQRTRNPE
jgi:dienelactone hydrolase